MVADRDVPKLVYDYLDLEQLLPHASSSDEKISGSKEAPIPIAAHVEALQRSIWHVTTTWEGVLRDHCRLSEQVTRGVRDGWAVQTALQVITPRVRVLAAVGPVEVWRDGVPGHPDPPAVDLPAQFRPVTATEPVTGVPDPVETTGAEALLQLVSLHGRARHLLGITKLTHQLPGDCSHCGAQDLRRDNGADTVYCAWCPDGRWSWVDYQRYVKLELEYRGEGAA
jgi:hypothetical protein